MKSALRGLCYIIIFILAFLALGSSIQKRVIKNELSVIVDNAMNATQRVIMDKRYPIESNEEYIAEFNQNLLREKTSDAKITVKVYGIDYTKGLLDVEVSETYTFLNGKKATEVKRKTGIIDVIDNNR